MTLQSSPAKRALLGLLALSAVLGAIGSARADATLIVDTTLDAVDAAPGDGLCATPAGGCALRAALQEANALPGADRISLPPGTYSLTIAGRGEDAAASGDLDVAETVSIDGAGSVSSVVDGGALDRVFHVVGVGAVLSASRIAIRNGAADPTNEIGGGISNSAGSVTLVESVVSDNSAWLAGGIGNPSPGAVTVIRSEISGNRAVGFAPIPGAGGVGLGAGGIGNVGSLTVIDSTIRANSVTVGNSGGIGSFGTVSISGSTISDNFGASASGGIGFGSGTAAVITNSTVSGNSTRGDGGGIGFTAGTLRLDNVTITNNAADVDRDGAGNGGGIISSRSPTILANTILAGNVDPGAEAPDCAGILSSAGYNLVQNRAGCTLVSGPGDVTEASPNLGPLADNGGPTDTHALLPGSPAIDAGNPAPPNSEDGSCAGTDQRGVFRPQDGNGDLAARCDIGAFELGFVTSTLGKVTGAGSVVDSSGVAEASFGFSVKAVAAPSGSTPAVSGALSYTDESADLEISGNRFDLLVIDMEEAEFTGTASVNGASRMIRVTVGDFGEPGRSDTFEIEVLEAGGYANGTRTLVGGNVQVHQ